MKELFKCKADYLITQQAQNKLYNACINKLEQKIHELKKQVSKQKKVSSVKKVDKEAHRLIFRYKKKDSKVKTDKTDIILKLNQTFVKKDFSSFMQVIDAEYILSEIISVLLSKKVINLML